MRRMIWLTVLVLVVQSVIGRQVQRLDPAEPAHLGDNREASFDSRIEGYVTRERLVGVMIRHMAGRPIRLATSIQPRVPVAA
jgi:hypothetical protein